MPAPFGPITASSSPGLGAEVDPAQRLAVAVALDQAARLERGRRRGLAPLPSGGKLEQAVRVRCTDEAAFHRRRRRQPGPPRPRRRDAGAARAPRPDLIVVNGENSAGGLGITEKTAADLFDAGADVITTGNHVYRHRDAYDFLDREERVVRPANYPHGNPGRGHTVIEKAGQRIGIVNLSGTVQMRAARSPFHEADAMLERLAAGRRCDRRLPRRGDQREGGDGLASRRPGGGGLRHPHPRAHRGRPRASGGTAYISDVGMTGSRAGVIGVKREQALESLITLMPVRFETAEDDVWVMGAAVRIGSGGLADVDRAGDGPGSGLSAASATSSSGKNQTM